MFVFQMTSLGDIFYQEFKLGQTSRDTTWSLGPGSKNLHLTKEAQDYCKKWIAAVRTLHEENVRSHCPQYKEDVSQFKEGTHH